MITIKGELWELLDLIRNCEYNRVTRNCDNCLFKGTDEVGIGIECVGIDSECRLEVEEKEDGDL